MDDLIEKDLHEHIRNRMATVVFDIAGLLDPMGAKARVAVTGAAVCIGMAAAFLVKSRRATRHSDISGGCLCSGIKAAQRGVLKGRRTLKSWATERSPQGPRRQEVNEGEARQRKKARLP